MSGSTRTVRGSFVGTGAIKDVLEVGIRPARLELFNVTDPTEASWSDTMPDASMFKRVAAGTATFPTTGGITPLPSGFRIGADSDMNVAGEVVHFIAYER